MCAYHLARMTTMDPKLVERKFIYKFSWLLLIWIMVMNGIVQTLGVKMGFVHFGWAIFIGNIMFFTLHEENLWKKFAQVTIGGFVGLIFAYLLTIGAMNLAMKGVGAPWYILIPLLPMVFCLVILSHKLPYIFNNVGFAYLICGTMNSEAMLVETKQIFLTFLIWGTIFNIGGIIIWKAVMPWAISSAKKYMARQQQ